MATLHLLDAAGPSTCPATLAQMQACRMGDATAKVVLFGGAPLRRMAALVGLTVDAVMAPPLGKPWLAPSAGARLLAAFNPATLTAWSVDALLLARLRLPHVPATLRVLQAPTSSELRTLAWLQRWRPFALQAPQALLTGGALTALQARLTVEGVSLPLVSVPAAPTPSDTTSSSLLLLGTRSNAWRGASMAGILDMMQGAPPHTPPRHSLCLLPSQPGLAHARRLTAHLGQSGRLQPDARGAWPLDLLPACQTTLVLAAPDGVDAIQTVLLPALAAHGWPLVVEDAPVFRALVAAGNPATTRIHWRPMGDAPALAHALLQS